MSVQLQFHQLSKWYYTEQGRLCAVDSLDWQGESGQVYGFLGPNGSGKTSTIKMLLNLLRPDTGEIFVNGEEWGNRTPVFRSSVGYLPEERGLYKKDRAIDVLVYFAKLKGVPSREATARARTYLEEFELIDHANATLDSFSKGMSQKIQLIMALIHRPEIVILDEPFTGLDPLNVRFVRDVIAQLKSRGALVILSTHRMDEAERLCDGILMLQKGKIALCGSQRELREKEESSRISLAIDSSIDHFVSVGTSSQIGERQEVILAPDATLKQFFAELAEHSVTPKELHVTPISLEELYIRAVQSL